MAYNIPNPPEPIAIVGAGCRFSGDATSPSKLWELLCRPVDLTREVPPKKFNAQGFYHEDGEYHGTTNSIKAYWLEEDSHLFDSGFFGIAPREAEAMDPQQRLSLEVVFEAMESAGFPLSQYRGKRVGVFSGCMTQDYESLSARDELLTSQYFATGNSRAMLSNRISYFFDFQGPSMTIDTACSSSLVALNEAVLSLRAGDCTMACVTGANLMLTPEQFIVESSLHMLSPSGKCHMWDTRADGYARGEGFAAVLIKPLSLAIADGDKIEGIIRAVGINADGRTDGITLPNPIAQATLIRHTYRKAGLDPKNPADRCQYFEAHGTGTAAGDPREAEAIDKAFFGALDSDQDNSAQQPSESDAKLLVGSIKTVIGHTEAAAGLAGLLKTVWAMKHGLVPPNLHFENLSLAVKPFYTHLQIPTVLTPWPAPPSGQPRRASINSFGFGGANAHAIVESYTPGFHDHTLSTSFGTVSGVAIGQATGVLASQPQPNDHPDSNASPFYLPIVISATSQKSLRDFVQSHRTYLKENDVNIHELAWHQHERRTDFPYHVAFSAATKAEALNALDSLLGSNESTIAAERVSRYKASDAPLRILGIFTGQGAQWPAMSRTLLLQNSVYRDTIRKLGNVLQTCFKSCEWTLEGQIMTSAPESRIQESTVSQPVCTAVQIALVDFVRSVGIDFHTVVGHSSGEIAAAYAAGRISAEDAIKISYVRGQVAHKARGRDDQKGGMLAARMSEAEALELCRSPLFAGRLDVAASNSPNSVTLSGDIDAISQAHEQLKANGKVSTLLSVKTAYHSYHMKAPDIDYAAEIKALNIVPIPEGNGIIWVSSVKGLPRTQAKELEFKYWEDNMVSQVEFTQAIEYALSRSSDVFDCAIEIGPHPALQSPVSETAKSLGRTIPYTSPLIRNKDDGLSVSKFLEFMWYNFGPLKINLRSYIEHSPIPDLIHSRLSNAPSYPFDHSIGYWRESRIARQFQFRTDAPHELLGIRSRDDNMYEMKWRNILKTEKIQWLEHHSFQGQALLPASAYCVMALDAARYYLSGRPASLIELRDIEIFSGIAIDRGSAGIETLFTLNMSTDDKDSSTIDGTFALYSCPADGTAKMKKDASGSLHIVLGQPSWDILPPRQPSLSETTAADPEAFYEMMNETGLTYTGPFKAIATIQRHYRYCCATVRRFHPDDTTKLGISPATLDACFQSAFLTYTFPDDGSLWTSFLPTRISRIKFNLAALESSVEVEPQGILTADTHLARVTSPVEASRASIAVDSAIFNKAGHAEIHIEDLVVRALSNTSPENDQELYLHTVMDVDPTDEIVQVNNAVSDEDGVLLAENCRRIASFVAADYVGDDTSATQHESSTDTQEAIDIMIRNSYHTDYLASIMNAGQLDPNRLSEKLSEILVEAHEVSIFRNHVGRIVKQIAHRYPWMIMLYMPTEQLRLTRLILNAVGDSFKSFKIGVSQENSFSESEHAEIRSHQGLIKELDINTLDQPEHQLGPDNRLDLMILPTSVLGDDGKMKTLTNLGSAMKPGGFLVLIDLNPTVLAAQSKKRSDDDQPPTPPSWPDVLDAYGFTRQARNSDFYHSIGSVFVRQFGERKSFKIPPTIMGSATITGQLLLLRGVCGEGEEGNSQLATSLQDQISPYCRETMCRTLDDATTQELESCDAIIVLADLDEPVMSNMTQHRIKQFQTLLRPGLTALWVTCDSRSGNPEHAASFGFLRTMAAEMPSLKLQVLDLDPNDSESPTDRISSTFYQLASTSKEDNHTMWTLEPEIHMENGRRLIPRVMSWKEGNDRVNALHRIVTAPMSTTQHRVELVPEVLPNGTVRFGLKNHPREEVQLGKMMIQVEYSVALPFNLQNSLCGYVCVGREHTTGKQMAVLTSTNSSYISCLPSQTLDLERSKGESLVVLHKFIRRIAALETLSIAPYEGPIVLIDPDVEFAKQLVYIAPKTRRVIIFGTCCNEEDKARYAKMIECDQLRRHVSGCLHPQSLLGILRQAFPKRGLIFNFLPQSQDLSKRIEALIPTGCTTYTGFNTSVLEALESKADKAVTNSVWESAMKAVLRQTPEEAQMVEAISTVSLSDLQSHPSGIHPFQIVDWHRDSNAVQTISHTIDEPLLFSDKTYYLFGMTGDFGHSLCRLFLERGARNIVLASRNPNTSLNWVAELNHIYAADIRIEKADVTNIESLHALKGRITQTMPPPGGVVNGAMVLDDRSFAQMTIESWHRVMRPKTLGSANLDTVFSEPTLDFFIMTSSFAAIGGHAGQSNYAAANMYMNGLAAQRRARGLPGTALNIGVIYGLGFLNREKAHLYAGLEREGYPPISEHNLHHMFLEAIVAGRPDSQTSCNELQQNPFDITTGLLRFRRGSPRPLHWHEDLRFGHFALRSEWDVGAAEAGTNKKKKSLREEIAVLSQKEAIVDTIGLALEQMLRTLMQFPEDASIDMNSSLMDLGLDSLTAVEVRNWFNKSLDKDFAVIRITNAPSIRSLCVESADQILATRAEKDKTATAQ
ncbi:hypothetical protein F5Y03DRAFT_408617 [Xylaria venustula]|nr:hypothetical protein F5Y03DRAFT_408617 [Xylaria venustula]